MTFREILGAVGRKWYVVLAFMAFGTLLSAVLQQSGGTYATHTVVAFSAPGDYESALQSALDDGSSNQAGAVAFAAALTRVINNGREPDRYGSTEVPLWGAGLQDAVLVTVPSGGNQWSTIFANAEIEVQVVNRSATAVARTQQAIVERIRELTVSQQDAFGVPEGSRITMHVEPLSLEVIPVRPRPVETVLGVAAILAAALMLGFWAAVTVDRVDLLARIRRPRRRRRWRRSFVDRTANEVST